VGALLAHPHLSGHAARLDGALVSGAIRDAIAAERARLLAGDAPRGASALAASAAQALDALEAGSLRRVVNATGIVLNTNLGRAPLPPAAVAAIHAVAAGYSNLEVDLGTGERGSRHAHVEAIATRLTGAEAALVVNNCAAAVLLVVDAFARGREVVVSRGELIEIGGSFRLPDVIASGGARLVEVGTTNRTYLADYARAIGPETGLLLASHTSNYRITGFTADVPRAELAALGRAHGVVTVEDLGSGLLVDLTRFGLAAEPTVAARIAAGLDLVLVSGDKLMGGPQCGLILGRAEAIATLKRHPLMRALRPDKLALAALAATLALYLAPDSLTASVPLFAMIAKTPESLKAESIALAESLKGLDRLTTEVLEGAGAIGGGTLPGVELPTWLVAVRIEGMSAAETAARLRTGDPAVVGRIADDRVLLDPRAWLDGDAERVRAALARAGAR
jgi:L-seryl-tRNA(Ser) seleniumtransferase